MRKHHVHRLFRLPQQEPQGSRQPFHVRFTVQHFCSAEILPWKLRKLFPVYKVLFEGREKDCQGNIGTRRNVFTVRNEVAKVMFLHVSVILSTGGMLSQHALQVVSQHALQGGGGVVCAIPACIAGGIPACLAVGVCVLSQHALQVVSQHALQQGEVCSQGGACWGRSARGGGGVKTPPKSDGYCCGRYASYWNAFLFKVLVWLKNAKVKCDWFLSMNY